MSDYDLVREYALVHGPDRKQDTAAPEATQTAPATSTKDAVTVAKAVQHGRPETLGASGAAHLQRMAGNAATSALVAQKEEDPSLVHKVIGSGGGSSLDDGTRTSMEQSFRADFSNVRVHSGGEAAAAAKSVQAQAFTVGNDIVLGEGKSTSDTHTIAHELTHVVQQRAGDVPGEPIGGGLNVSDPGDWAERQAVATADKVVEGGESHAGHDHASAGVQREADEGDDALQMLAVQREEAPADEEQDEEGTNLQGEFLQREGDEEDPAVEEEAG